MPYISYSALKDWKTCPFYYKLTRVDRVSGFQGNEFTAFGSAIHSVCEQKLLKVAVDPIVHFLSEFKKNIFGLPKDVELDAKLIREMGYQGQDIIPEIEGALKEYFKEYEVVAVELPLYEKIHGEDYDFKGYIDAIVKTADGKHHIFDWKTTSWGWDARRRSEKIVTYQLTLYKFFYSQKTGVPMKNIETHFALLKRTAKKERVEFFRVTSGPRKTENALKLLKIALYNIRKKRYIKNRASCEKCMFHKTEHCP